MEGGEEEKYLLLSSSPPASRGRQRRRRLSQEESDALPSLSCVVPSVRRSGWILGWIGVDWVGKKTNPSVAKCVFCATR
jgi:hypothetical protein